MKICTKCKQKKDFSEFTKDKYKKDGFRCSCKLCNKKGYTKREKTLLEIEKIKKGYKYCTKCKKDLSIDNFRKDSSKGTGYCSSCNECHRKRLGIKKLVPGREYNCDGCGITFKPRVNQFNNIDKIYCSRECKMKISMKNKKTRYYGYRKYILERDGNRCVISGETENLHIHHIITRGAGGNNEYNNLITLSAKAHREKAHGMELGKYRKIFLEYTSKYKRPDFWDEIMYKSSLDEDKKKKRERKIYKDNYRKNKKVNKVKQKQWTDARNKKSRELYNKGYSQYIRDFKKKHGITPTQYQYRKQKEYLKQLNKQEGN